MTQADWDFNHNNHDLYATLYVSSPTSLRSKTGTNDTRFLRNTADCLAVNQGRIVTWFYRGGNHAVYLVLRCQAPVGDGNWISYRHYRVNLGANSQALHWDGAAADWTGSQQTGIAKGAWHKVRVTWWNGRDLSDNPALVILLEKEIAGVWTQLGKWYDTNNFDDGAALNRVGGGLGYPLLGTMLADDTEIWRAS